MLHKTVGTIRESFFLFTLRIQSDQVTGYIFDFALGTLFHFFPRTGPQFVQAGSFSLLPFILGYFMQGMNGNKYHILILINKFNHFLGSISIRNAYRQNGLHHDLYVPQSHPAQTGSTLLRSMPPYRYAPCHYEDCIYGNDQKSDGL